MSLQQEMSVKPEMPSSTTKVKRERKAIDLVTKMHVIRQYENGKKVSEVARIFRLSHSTVSTILKDRERIRVAVKSSAPLGSTVITRQRTGINHDMEKLLYVWIREQEQDGITLSHATIQTKARSIFQCLKAQAGNECNQDFVASNGWFRRFQKRFQIHQDRMMDDMSSGDEETARRYVEIVMGEGQHNEEAMDQGEQPHEKINECLIKEEPVEFHEGENGIEALPLKTFTHEGLSDVFSHVNQMLEQLSAMDCDDVRFKCFEQTINEALRPYRAIYNEIKAENKCE